MDVGWIYGVALVAAPGLGWVCTAGVHRAGAPDVARWALAVTRAAILVLLYASWLAARRVEGSGDFLGQPIHDDEVALAWITGLAALALVLALFCESTIRSRLAALERAAAG